MNTPSEDKHQTMLYIRGKTVCLPVWLAILGLKQSRYYEVQREFLGGAFFISKLTSPKSHQSKSCEAIAWLHNYFNQVGDHMPDRMAIHLPSFLTTIDIYTRMKEELHASGRPVVCQSHFYNLWSSHFSHVSIPKVCSTPFVSFVHCMYL